MSQRKAASRRVARRVSVVLVGLFTVGIAGLITPATAEEATTPADATCAPLDLVLMVDSTGSMRNAIEGVKREIVSLISQIEDVSGGDYRIGLIEFGVGVQVRMPLTATNAAQITEQIEGLRASGGADAPEAWDQALVTAVDLRTAADVDLTDPGRQSGDFDVPWRPEAEKMIILITDARPAGFDDRYDEGDQDRAYAVAVRAGTAGIRIATVFIPNGSEEEDAPYYLQYVANLSGSTYFATSPDGGNLTDGLELTLSTCAADTDGDGLYDIWETEGYDADGDGVIDVDLPAMGADPNHKDLFVQVNWMFPEGAAPCFLGIWCPPAPDGPHEPNPDALAAVAEVFADAPVANPDGTTGIRVHFDAGPLSGTFPAIPEAQRQGGSMWFHQEVLFPGDADDEERDQILADLESRFLAPERAAVFTWVVYAHRIVDANEGGLMGLAPGVPGDTVLLADPMLNDTYVEAATLTHELGHTLGLRHGGLDDLQGKPNYASTMNYDVLHGGGLIRGDREGVIDFSRVAMAPLDESAGLDEALGLSVEDRSSDGRPSVLDPDIADLDGLQTFYRCAAPSGTSSRALRTPALGPVDWNCDGDTLDEAVLGIVHDAEDEGQTVLLGRDDWATLTFTGGSRGALESSMEPVDETGLTVEVWRATPKEYAVAASGPGLLSTGTGTGLSRVWFHVENIGTLDDTYTLTAAVTGDWDAAPTLETRLAVPSGDSGDVAVDLVVPPDTGEGATIQIALEVVSQAAPWVTARPIGQLTIGESAPLRPSGTLKIDPLEPRTGDQVTVAAAGLPVGQSAILYSAGWQEPLVVNADDAGVVTVDLIAPTPGKYTISLLAADSADPTQPRLLQTSLGVAEPPLPVGVVALVVSLAVLVVLLVAAGIFWRYVRRTRAAAPAEPSEEASGAESEEASGTEHAEPSEEASGAESEDDDATEP